MTDNKWYPFDDQKEFLETVMRHTAFSAMCLVTLHSFSESEALLKIYDSDFYDALEHIESDNYRVSAFWTYYQLCLEFEITPVEMGRPVLEKIPHWYKPLIYIVEYLKLFLVNDNGINPSGWLIFQCLKRNNLLSVIENDFKDSDSQISEVDYAEQLAEKITIAGFHYTNYTR